jgi:roadblock/LC7 domain-containing protein
VRGQSQKKQHGRDEQPDGHAIKGRFIHEELLDAGAAKFGFAPVKDTAQKPASRYSRLDIRNATLPAELFAVAWDHWSACIIGRGWDGMVYVESSRKGIF